MTDMKFYEVKAPSTLEDSAWNVVAESPDQAAAFYVKAALAEEISVDLEEIADGGTLRVTRLVAMGRGPGLVPWEDTAEVIFRLADLPDWRAPDALPAP